MKLFLIFLFSISWAYSDVKLPILKYSMHKLITESKKDFKITSINMKKFCQSFSFDYQTRVKCQNILDEISRLCSFEESTVKQVLSERSDDFRKELSYSILYLINIYRKETFNSLIYIFDAINSFSNPSSEECEDDSYQENDLCLEDPIIVDERNMYEGFALGISINQVSYNHLAEYQFLLLLDSILNTIRKSERIWNLKMYYNHILKMLNWDEDSMFIDIQKNSVIVQYPALFKLINNSFNTKVSKSKVSDRDLEQMIMHLYFSIMEENISAKDVHDLLRLWAFFCLKFLQIVKDDKTSLSVWLRSSLHKLLDNLTN